MQFYNASYAAILVQIGPKFGKIQLVQFAHRPYCVQIWWLYVKYLQIYKTPKLKKCPVAIVCHFGPRAGLQKGSLMNYLFLPVRLDITKACDNTSRNDYSTINEIGENFVNYSVLKFILC